MVKRGNNCFFFDWCIKFAVSGLLLITVELCWNNPILRESTPPTLIITMTFTV